MCRYCKGTGKYQLLDKVVDCDQCDVTVTDSESDEISISTPAPGVVEIRGTVKVNLPDDWTVFPHDDNVPF